MTRETPDASDYVGREGLRAALARALDAASAGSGGLALLVGPPGSGKSATLDWIAAEAAARGMAFARGRCADVDGAPAFLPWDEIQHALSGGIAAGAARAAGTAPGADAPTTDEAGAFRHMRETTDRLVRRAGQTPLVLAIDDLHASDPASAKLLAFVAREAARAPLWIAATTRPALLEPGHPLAAWVEAIATRATTLALEPLEGRDVAAIAATVAGQPVPPELARALCAQSRGNPLFVRQLVAMLVAREPDLRDPRCLATVAGLAPAGIRQAIAQQLAALPPATRALLSLASARGQRFEGALVERAWRERHHCDPPGLDEALATDVVRGDAPGSFAFTHALFREGLRDAVAEPERAAQHAALARAIRAGGLDARWVGPCAHHALASAGAVPALEAATLAAEAGALALQRHAQEEALDWGDRALQLLAGDTADTGDRGDTADTGDTNTDGASAPSRRALEARLLLLRGQARWRCGQTQLAREDFEAASDLGRALDDPRVLAEAAVGHVGRTDVALGIPERDMARLEEAAERLPDAPTPLRVELLTLIATNLYFSPDRRRREAASHAAVACAEASGEPALVAKALTGAHFARIRPGRLAARAPLGARAVAMAVRGDDLTTAAHARFGAVYDALEAGDLAAADRQMAAYGAIAEKLRQPFLLWQHRAMRVTRALAAGRLAEAEAGAAEALALGEQAQSENARAVYAAHLFALRRAQGRLAELDPLVVELGERLPSMPSFAFARAEIVLAHGRRDEAHAFLRAASAQGFRDLPDDMNAPALASIATRLCVALDDAEAAAVLYEWLRPLDGTCIVLGLGNVWDGATALYLGRLAGVLGDLERAWAHLAAAETLHARVGARLLLAETWVARARVLERGGDAEAAARLDARAVELQRSLGIAAPGEAGAPAAAASTRGAPGPGHDDDEAAVSRFVRIPGGRVRVDFAGQRVSLPDSRGLTYIAELLARPGEAVHVLDLVARAAPEGSQAQPGAGGMELLDARARREYRERIEGLREEREEAEARGDATARDAARAELEALEDALASALGLGGRTRRAGDPVERARKSVYNRVHAAIRRIGSQHPALAAHLQEAIQTGRSCMYAPAQPLTWLLPAAQDDAGHPHPRDESAAADDAQP